MTAQPALSVLMGIGYYHRHRTSAFLPDMPMHRPSALVRRYHRRLLMLHTYVYREHVATEDAGLGLYIGSSSQGATGSTGRAAAT